MIPKFLYNLHYSILFIFLVFLLDSTRFAKKRCGERVNEKVRKDKRTFFYELVKFQHNTTEKTLRYEYPQQTENMLTLTEHFFILIRS